MRDHCHETGVSRERICRKCNTGLGWNGCVESMPNIRAQLVENQRLAQAEVQTREAKSGARSAGDPSPDGVGMVVTSGGLSWVVTSFASVTGIRALC